MCEASFSLQSTSLLLTQLHITHIHNHKLIRKAMEVISISNSSIYKKMIGSAEVTIVNILPQFKDEEERQQVETQIKQTLYDIFSKYVEKEGV